MARSRRPRAPRKPAWPPAPAQQTPQAALERYARLYVNWTADRVAGIQRELASLSTGQARAQALQAAASYTRDQTLTQSNVANSGHLVAITPSVTTPGQWVLVTSEQTSGTGDYAGPPADAARHLRASHADPVGLGRKRMGTAELTCRSTHASVQKMDARLRCRTATHALRLALVYALLWTITLLGALLGTAFPGLAPGGRPHPALHGELGRARVDRGRQRPGPVRAVPARLLPLPGSALGPVSSAIC